MKNLFHKSFPLLFVGLLVGSALAQPVEAQQRQRGQQMSQEQREQMRDRYLENLSPEQREAMQKRMSERYNNGQYDKKEGVESWLTPEQREEVKALRLDMMEKRLALKNQLNEAKARLKTVSTGETINEAEAKKLIDKMHELEADVKKLEWDLRMDVRAMLTDDQQVRFDQMPWPRMEAERGKAPMRRAKMVKKAYEHRHEMHKKHHMMY